MSLSTAAASAFDWHSARRTKPKANWLRDVILGGQDGLVNILGIVLGVIGGGVVWLRPGRALRSSAEPRRWPTALLARSPTRARTRSKTRLPAKRAARTEPIPDARMFTSPSCPPEDDVAKQLAFRLT